MSSANSAQERSNLARIRDNQRRSRARRKEYLQSLEARWRSCELQGVEASAEIQSVARKVVEENRKLRGLLNTRGMSEGEIDMFLRDGGQIEGMAPVLEGMLGRRKQCRGAGSVSERRYGDAIGWTGGGCNGSGQQPLPPTTLVPQPSAFDGDFNSFIPFSTTTDLAPDLITAAAPKDTTQCLVGASLIAGMGTNADPEEVTAAMGCLPGGEGNCQIDNASLLKVMDRFTEGV